MSALMTETVVGARAARAGAPDRADGACVHCGLALTPGQERFCCSGCHAAHTLIHEGGLDRYYRLREGEAGQRPVNAGGARTFAEFDTPAFLALHCGAGCAAGSVRSIELQLEGVHCAACVWLLERLGRLLPAGSRAGLHEARLDYGRRTLRLTWDTSVLALSTVARTLDRLGYTPHASRAGVERGAHTTSDRRMLARIGIAGACAGNVMLIFLALYAGAFSGMAREHVELFRWVSMALSVVCLAWPGRVFLDSAWAALRTRTPHLDVPIALGLLLGTVWGVVNTVRGAGELYFDSISVLIFFLLIGRYVQQRQQRWAVDALELLFNLTPASAWLVEDGEVREVPSASLTVGQTVEVRSGQCVPVDGTVLAGASSIDRALLSGESRPVPVGPGDAVYAGTTNLGAALRVRVDQTGEHTRVGRLMRMVQAGAHARAPIVQLADRAAGWFLGVILVLAAGTVAWWWRESPPVAIERAVALLVVTCPCGLGLATPLVMTIALGRAARAGVLIKSAGAIEALGRVTPARRATLLLDKTGTLTTGGARVQRWTGTDQHLRMGAALLGQSAHHVAQALVLHAGGVPAEMLAREVREHTGRGVSGTVDGFAMLAGSAAWVAPQCRPLARAHQQAVEQALSAGLSPVLVAVEGVVVGVGAIGSDVRPEARAVVRSLRARGCDGAILSGDAQALVTGVARQVGIDEAHALGQVMPEGKLTEVDKARADSRTVVMVGDGVNDAPALARATVGIAVHGGAEASLAAADVYLTRPSLQGLDELMAGSRRAVRAIHLTFVTSVLYNVIAAALCVTGHIDPLLAAIIMPASSFTVLAVAVLFPTFRATTGAPSELKP
jgi:Cu2+-exporting ATPase